MVVMRFRRSLVAGAAVAKLMALQDAGFFEEPNGPVHGGDRDVRVYRRRSRVKRFNVGMVFAVAKHARNRLALLGDAKPLVGAKGFDVDVAAHSVKLGTG